MIEATEEASAQCTAAGGTPAILDGYRVTLDLNGNCYRWIRWSNKFLYCREFLSYRNTRKHIENRPGNDYFG